MQLPKAFKSCKSPCIVAAMAVLLGALLAGRGLSQEIQRPMQNLSGAYSSNWGQVTLTQTENGLKGFWLLPNGKRGEIKSGLVDGKRLIFQYQWGEDTGTAVFTRSESDPGFWEGNFRHVSGQMGSWNLKLSGKASEPPSPAERTANQAEKAASKAAPAEALIPERPNGNYELERAATIPASELGGAAPIPSRQEPPKSQGIPAAPQPALRKAADSPSLGKAAPEISLPSPLKAPDPKVSAPIQEYVSWFAKRWAKTDEGKKRKGTGPVYQLSSVLVEPRYISKASKYETVDIMEKGGSLANQDKVREQTERYVVSNPGAPPGQQVTQPVKLPVSMDIAQNWQVRVSADQASVEWSDKYDHNAPHPYKPNEAAMAATHRLSQYKISLPGEFSLGDPLVISFNQSYSASASDERMDDFSERVADLTIHITASPWLVIVPMDVRFDLGSKKNTAKVNFDMTLTPVVKDSGIRYGLDISGESVAQMDEETKRKFAALKSPESQIQLEPASPLSKLQFQISGAFNTGGSPITLVYTLEKAPRFWKCEPLLLPPAGGVDASLASIASEHEQLGKEIGKIIARPVPEKRPDEDQSDFDKRLLEFLVQREKDVVAKDDEMRLLERRWFEKIPDAFGGLTEEGRTVMREALSAEATCLAKAVTASLGEMRAHEYRFTENSDYLRARRLYDQYLKDLQHVLSLWTNVNKMELMRLELLASEYRRAQAARDPEFKEADLAALKLRLKNTYVDEGWIYTLRELALTQDAIDARDSYGEGLKAAKAANEKLPGHDEFLKRAAQRAITGTQYLMAIFNTMWTAFVDSITRLVNSADSGGLIDTMAEESDKQIAEVQRKSLERLAALALVRGFESEQMKTLGDWLVRDGAAPADEARLRALDENRMFQEATSGGLLRFAACMDSGWDEILDKEYRIAAHHGRLVLAEMRQTVNLREGREAGGKDPLLKRMLDPLGTWKSVCSNLRGNYDSMEDYLAERSGQLDEMEGLRPRLLLMHFDLDYLEKNLPKNYQMHYSLSLKNPDYMSFLERHRILWGKMQEEAIEAEARKEEDVDERGRLAFKISLMRTLEPQGAQSAMPAILKQQLLDRVAVLDFDGAVAVARELEAVEPEAAKGLSAWLANDLAWEQAKEIGINTWVSLGNGGLYTAFFTRYFSPAAVRNAPVSLSNLKAVFSSWNGFSGFLQFTWGRVNPFSSLTKGELTPKKLLEATAQIAKAAAEQVEQQAIGKGILSGYFGVDEKYADFIANTLINMQQIQTDDPTSLLNTTCRNVLRRIDAYAPDKIDVPGWKKVMAARGMMREYWQAVEARAELEKAMLQLEDANRSKGKQDFLGIGEISRTISKAKLKLRLILNPLNEESIRSALDDYDIDTFGKKGVNRLKAQSELFEMLPLAALVKAKKDGKLSAKLETKIDGARREMLQTIQTEFLQRHPVLGEFVERFIYTGSGARPDWPEYKRLSSDLDFTIVLKEGTTLENRAKVKATFDEFFRSRVNFAPEEFDIHCFADERPRLSSRGMTVESLLELVGDPKAAERLAAEISKNNESLLRDLADPERYLSTGALRFLHYLNKLGGKAKRASGDELSDDESYQSGLYKDVKFEPWMGLEMVMDNLKMVGAHSGSRLDYAKALAKYGLRVLFARVIQSEKGLKMANDLTVEQIEQNIAKTGGIHGEFVRMAEQLGGKFTPQQLVLFREMNLRKQGRPWSEVFEERLGRKVSDSDPALNFAVEKHITEMEGFVKQSLTECVLTNATHMKQLANAIDEAKEPAAKEALTLKYREILYSVSEVWNSLGDGERKTVLSSAPAESEMFTALEDVRNAVRKRDLDAIKSYKPFRKRSGTPMSDDK